MTFYIIRLIGFWNVMDALFSINVYLSAPSYNGVKQTWKRDHWVRVVRGLLGIVLIVIGGMNV